MTLFLFEIKKKNLGCLWRQKSHTALQEPTWIYILRQRLHFQQQCKSQTVMHLNQRSTNDSSYCEIKDNHSVVSEPTLIPGSSKRCSVINRFYHNLNASITKYLVLISKLIPQHEDYTLLFLNIEKNDIFYNYNSWIIIITV